MNKNVLYIGIAIIVGLFIGWLIFSVPNKGEVQTKSVHEHSGETAVQRWTCSMHPQIIRPEPGDCPICGMDLIPLESDVEGLALNEIKMTKNAMALANVTTTVVGTTSSGLENIGSLSGKIEVNEEANTIQSSYFDGRLEQLYIDYEGQEVKKGQLLATIYAPNLVAAQQELITSLSLRESQPALYNAVRNKLKLWKLSEEQINSIEKSGKVKENFPVYASVSGTVTDKMALAGDYVKQGQPLFKVSSLSSVWVEFDVYENQISLFKIGQKMTIIAAAYPNMEFKGTVSFINPVLDTQTRTVSLRATLSNEDGLFKPGMFVRGSIENTNYDVDEQKLVVPATAVMWTGERSLVYVKMNGSQPVFQMREIKLGNRRGETFTVVSGLKNGEEIVTNGVFTVDAAAQLQGKKSMMNQGDEDMGTGDTPNTMKMEFPIAFQNDFQRALPYYFKVKNAFVEGNAQKVSDYATETLPKLTSIDVSVLNKMEKSHFIKIVQALEKISIEKDLLLQRDDFVILNENLVPIVFNIGKLEGTVFVQKCPMANSNRGAFWLSSEKEIRNPYYGDQMMTCGSVIDIIN
ncbi:efflux RND transporter periplasmic adaptor subunit [Maribacter sp. CXY002]|uniref:efflux RND transporter periplasmic adaptor subunit n=1 Tax=Maribacter luteocoastalis TaxID=3407671 RepID=UPI003B671B81